MPPYQQPEDQAREQIDAMLEASIPMNRAPLPDSLSQFRVQRFQFQS